MSTGAHKPEETGLIQSMFSVLHGKMIRDGGGSLFACFPHNFRLSGICPSVAISEIGVEKHPILVEKHPDKDTVFTVSQLFYSVLIQFYVFTDYKLMRVRFDFVRIDRMILAPIIEAFVDVVP